MEFHRLSRSELLDFINDGVSNYNVEIDNNLSLIEQSEQVWDQLQLYPEVVYPYPVVDLYIAKEYSEAKDKRPGSLIDFVIEFGVNPEDKLYQERIMRISKFLDIDPSTIDNPTDILLQTPVIQEICPQLSLDEIGKFLLSMGQISVQCHIPINDKDGNITSIDKLNIKDINLIKSIENLGSRKVMIELTLSGDVNGVKSLIDLGVDPNFFVDGSNPLFYAIDTDQAEITRILLEAGADVEVSFKYMPKWTPMSLAANENSINVVKYLLERGDDPNFHPYNGLTPLLWAALEGHVEMVKLLLENGADPDIQSHNGETALIISIFNLNSFAKINSHLSVADLQAKIDKRYQHMIDVIKLLLDSGADPNIQDNLGRTVITLAEDHEYDKIVELFKPRQ